MNGSELPASPQVGCEELVRTFPWEKTPLGARQAWPSSLKTIVGVLLKSRHPMFLWWGEELIQIYNDAYVPSFGVGKHPVAMGQRGRDCWREIWSIIGPQIEGVMRRGEPSWNVDHLVPIWRNGRIEEVYWTYGYSPVFIESGAVGGTLVVCTETTPRILAERRLGTIRTLALELLCVARASAMFSALMSTLRAAERDVPFATIYTSEGSTARVGLGAEQAALLDASVGKGLPAGRHTLPQPIEARPWPEPVSEVLVLPLGSPEGARPPGFIVFGLSPRLPFDAAYQNFLELLVENLSAAEARARVDEERRNLLEMAPVAAALLRGADYVFEIANPRYRAMVGREVLGKGFFEAFPEMRGGDMQVVLERAYRTGEPFVMRELPVELRDEAGELGFRYYTFNLEPIKSSAGSVTALMLVAVDITDQVTARMELERRDEERGRLLLAADAAVRAKDEFLAMLGHELRNPLAPILTALHLMKTKEAGANRREREIIERQASHLIHLVDDLLDASRVAQGKVELKRVHVSLSDIVGTAVEMAAPLFEKKSHLLHLDVSATGLELYADPLRLAQVVSNLLTNAARYTKAGGRISVTARAEHGMAVLRVEDNGVGIAPGQAAQLFTMFFQVSRSRDRAEGGLGLGLALAKSLVELHGGSVHASSPGLGLGSVFEVRLPLAAESEAREVLASSSALAVRPESGTRVLLVDDNRDLADMLAQFLEDAGCHVFTAHDGPSALALAESARPSVAVIDIGLPVMDGYELAASLREVLSSERPRLIAMTGYGQAADGGRSQRAGFDRHLVKPVDVALLLQALQPVTE